MIFLTEPTEAHIRDMVGRIRQADIDEFAAGYSLSPERGIRIGIQVSSHSWAGIWRGRVIGIAGLHPPSFIGNMARPWMVGSRDLENQELRQEFLELSRGLLSYMASLYPHLENWVDVRNRKAVRWLRWLGFTIHPPEPHGPKDLPFHRFEYTRPDHV